MLFSVIPLGNIHSFQHFGFRPNLFIWKESLIEHLNKTSPWVTFIYYSTARFDPSLSRETSMLSHGSFPTTTMVSADFSRQLLSMFHTLFPHVRETSRGKTINFHSIYPHHLHRNARVAFGLRFVLQPYPHCICLMMFVFLGSELCRRLPSDSTSRWTPLP
jgi:hypothetical protein